MIDTAISGASLGYFLFAEMFLVLSLCFWSGSYESWASEGVGIESCSIKAKRFFHLNSSFNQFSVIICGFLGGYLSGVRHNVNAYWGALAVMGVLLILILSTSCLKTSGDSDMGKQKRTNLDIFWDGFRYSLKNSRIREIILISVGMQFLVQPLLHYWQPLLMDISPNLAVDGLGLAFAFFSGANPSYVNLFSIMGWVFICGFIFIKMFLSFQNGFVRNMVFSQRRIS